MPAKKPALAPYFALAWLLLDLFVFGFRFNPATDPRLAFFPTTATDFLRSREGSARITSYRYQSTNPGASLRWMPPNTPLAYNLRDIHGYDSLAPGRPQQLLGSSSWDVQGFDPPPNSSLANLMGIKYAFTLGEITAPNWRLAQSTEEGNIYENSKAYPRAFWVGTARTVEDAVALATIKRVDIDLSRIVLLSGASGSLGYPEPSGNTGQVVFKEDRLNRVALESEASQPGWLVLTDTAYPGWQATLDGKPAKWQIADYAFRALPVPAGKHEIIWSYLPASFKVGGFISLFALGILCSGWAASRPRPTPAPKENLKKPHEPKAKKSKTG